MKTVWRGLRAGWPGRATGTVDWAARIAFVTTTLIAIAGVAGLTRFVEGALGVVSAVALVFGVMLVVAVTAVGSLQTRLEAYERPALFLDYSGDDRSCHQEFWEGTAPMNRLGGELYRVRVTNPTGRTIESVTILLERFSPQGAAFLPLPLQMLADTAPWRDSRDGRPLHPRGSIYANVAGLGFRVDGGVGDMWLGYAANEPNTISPDRRYEFVVAAHARDSTPTRQSFVAWVRARRLYFCAAEDEATHPMRVTLSG